MQKIGPPDTHFLSAATGWVELGNLDEARAELRKITPARTEHPDVLEVRWLIHAREKNWEGALAVAKKLAELAPQLSSGWLHRAYALRRVKEGGVPAAWDALLPAFEKFPGEPIIPYNLACYACQMGKLDDARLWLDRAMKIADKREIKLMALNDEDLKPLRAEIEKL
jgi:Flp pilus assembly protein TadD